MTKGIILLAAKTDMRQQVADVSSGFCLLTIFPRLRLHFFNYPYLAGMNVQVSDAAMVTGASAVGGISAPIDIPAEDVIGAIEKRTGTLPQIDLEYEPEIGMLWITLKPEPKPVFTLPVIDSVRKVQAAIMTLWADTQQSPILFLAYRSRGPIFTLGGDLDFFLECIATNDRAGLTAYARLATEVINLNASSLGGLVITLATVHGKALGGGIDPARSCNVMIGEAGAKLGYPEIAFNHYPITAVSILSRRIGTLEAQNILMSGREYTAQEFFEKGVLDAVVRDGSGEDWLRKYASKCLSTHAARLALFSAFYRRAGDLEQELAEGAKNWVDHILNLKPLDIAKLQRIVQIQDKMLARLYHRRDMAAAGQRVDEGVQS